MKLLMTTQRVDENDNVLGFVHKWIKELSKNWDEIIVICLYEGKHSLPENVRVLSLGKEGGVKSKFFYSVKFLKYIWQERNNHDSVFVHMNPEYLVLAGWFWRIYNKRVAFWYVHKSLNTYLKIALRFVDIVFTATKKSVTFESPKLRPMGHGIDLDNYKCNGKRNPNILSLLSVGRITRIKQCEVLIEATDILKREYKLEPRTIFVGEPVHDDDRVYEKWLRSIVKERGLEENIIFTGGISLADLCKAYCDSQISINMVPTGGLDKAVIEAMASEALVMSSNESFKQYFGDYADRLYFKEKDSKELAEKINNLWKSSDRENVRKYLFEISKQFDVVALMSKISDIIKNI